MLNATQISSSARKSIGHSLNPIFDDRGLIPCVLQDARTNQILLFEWMDRRSLERTINTGITHYSLQGRKAIWRKYTRPTAPYSVHDMLLNEEQNCLLIIVDITTEGSRANLSISSFHREFDWQD